MAQLQSRHTAWQFARIRQQQQPDSELSLETPERCRVGSIDGCTDRSSQFTYSTVNGSPVHLGPMSPLLHTSPASESSGSRRSSSSSSSSSSYRQSTEDDALRSIAREAMKRVQSISTNAFVKGTWKQRRSQANELVLEHRSPSEYRIIAQSVVPCAIDEIAEVLSSRSSERFNAGMIELLGSEFSYGVTVRSVPAAEAPLATKTESSALSVKAISFGGNSLLSSSMDVEGNYLDYTERDQSLRTERRALQKISRRRGSDGRVRVTMGDSLCGYALHEDQTTKHTTILLYGTYSSPSSEPEDRALRHAAIHRLRKLAQLSTKWVQIAKRRRLGSQPILDPHADASRSLVELSCVGCDQEFHTLFRKRHFCHLCGLHACVSCSSVEDVEQELGKTRRLRVCHGCVADVSHRAFFPETQAVESTERPKYRLL